MGQEGPGPGLPLCSGRGRQRGPPSQWAIQGVGVGALWVTRTEGEGQVGLSPSNRVLTLWV